MARTVANPDRLFDRPWPAGHPLRPRIGAFRRWSMRLILLVLLAVIGTYAYATESRRVKAMAENYLAEVLNARVEVGKATLSIFEGLRLDDVAVYVDEGSSPDSAIFTAAAFRIDYSPRSILTGKLDARQIVAVAPHVRLVEDRDSGTWNYQRLVDNRHDPAAGPDGSLPDGSRLTRPELLPEIILRDARIDYSEIEDGRLSTRGSMAMEGRLSPASEPGRYNFDLQSRGPTEGVGAIVKGSIVPATGQFTLRMHDFDLGPDVLSMMPADVRRWCEEHQLSGRVDLPEMSFTPSGDDGGRPRFRVVTSLQGVTLAVKPSEWRSRQENAAHTAVANAISTVRLEPVVNSGVLTQLAGLLEPRPIRLEQVTGTFVFDENGIGIPLLRARVETNGLKVTGHIDGYTPDATARLRLTSLDSENIYIPHAPTYIHSLPSGVREVYNHLRPVGAAQLDFEMIRDEPGGRPRVQGEVRIVDGQFIFDKFPYPLRNVTGRIILGTSAEHGWEQIELRDLRGYGIAGGPNANSIVNVKGLIGPLGPECAVNIVVTGANVTHEPAVIAALPEEARRALTALDAEGNGAYPTFRLDFHCDVIRPFGRQVKWEVNTDLLIHEAAGALKAFPYPLNGLSGLIRVRTGRLEIVDGVMRRGDATLNFAGDFSWATPPRRDGAAPSLPETPPKITPNLAITARNVPIDADLVDALPPGRRKWVEKLGVAGVLDVEGRVLPPDDPDAGDYGFDFALALRDGTLTPAGDTPLASDVTARLHVTPTRIVLSDLKGTRDEAQLTGQGVATWLGDAPELNLSARATNLELDAPLYAALPAAAQRGWDAVQPTGSVDVEVTYSGHVEAGDRAAATTQPAGYQVVVRPRKLAVIPTAFPYPLDAVTGTVTVQGDRVTLTDITARHGEAAVTLAGVGELGAQSTWNLKLKAERVTTDAALIDALPQALADLTRKLSVEGAVSVEFDRFVYRQEPEQFATVAEVVDLDPPTTRESGAGSIDFKGWIGLDGTRLNVGVPLEQVVGRVAIEGSTRRGELEVFSGAVDVQSLLLSGRNGQNFKAELRKAADQPVLHIDKLRGHLAGGELAGDVVLSYPDDGPSRYAMNLALRNADVRQLAGEGDKDISGELAASLALEGAWDDPASRRGRGEVVVAGNRMYQIPVVLGLLEITNLALPINSPFKTATTRYSLTGNTVTFEQIELRSDQMRMAGSGSIDFDSKAVRLNFTTDNPNWPRLPVIGDLIQGARNDLLQIHVTGTVQEPKVSAKSLNTFQTTVDEVVGGR